MPFPQHVKEAAKKAVNTARAHRVEELVNEEIQSWKPLPEGAELVPMLMDDGTRIYRSRQQLEEARCKAENIRHATIKAAEGLINDKDYIRFCGHSVELT